MVDFVNKLELGDKKCQTNEILRGETYKGKLLFPMKYFMSFSTDQQSMYFMSTRLLEYSINGFSFLKTQPDFIHKKNSSFNQSSYLD